MFVFTGFTTVRRKRVVYNFLFITSQSLQVMAVSDCVMKTILIVEHFYRYMHVEFCVLTENSYS